MRSIGRLLAVSAASMATVALGAGVAHAAVAHEPIGSFSSEGEIPTGVAVNEETHAVYVANFNNGNPGTVFEFSSEGKAVLAGPITGVFGGHLNIAIDNAASSPSKGDLYVPDAFNNVVDKFTSEGVLICEIDGATTPCSATTSPALAGPEGVGVDPSTGYVYVSDTAHNVVDVFDPTGAFVTQITASNGLPLEGPRDIKVDSLGDVYVATLGTEVPYAVVKFTPSTEPATNATTWSESLFEATSNATAIAIDSANNVYTDDFNGSGLATERNPAGAVLGTFGSEVEVAYGMAVDSGTGLVYLSNLVANSVVVYNTVVTPTVFTEAATGVTSTAATLQGTVDAGGKTIEKCFFKYGAGFASEAPCNLTPAEINGAGGSVTVSAQLQNLEPGVEYPYNLVVEWEGHKLTEGQSTSLTTETGQSEPVTRESLAVGRHSAALKGSIDPKNSEARYYFEYGTSTSYGSVTVEGTIPAGSGNVPLSVGPVLAGELSPGTTYHYRLTVSSHGTAVHGPDATFVTLAPTPPSVGASSTPQVGQTGATINTSIEPDGLRTTYALEVGTVIGGEVIYGVTTFGEANGSEPVPLTFGLSNLLPGVTYHYRLSARNEDGVAVGPDNVFATGSFPALVLPPAPVQIVSIPNEPPPKTKTRAEKYREAVAQCNKKKNKRKRAACLRSARKRFGPIKKK